MNEKRYVRYASGEVPEAGDVVKCLPIGASPPLKYRDVFRVLGIDARGNPITELDDGSERGSPANCYILIRRQRKIPAN